MNEAESHLHLSPEDDPMGDDSVIARDAKGVLSPTQTAAEIRAKYDLSPPPVDPEVAARRIAELARTTRAHQIGRERVLG
jgi:hypothetical protein